MELFETYSGAGVNVQFTKLITIRDSIELMSKFNQVEVLRILTNNKAVTINENKYGIHINMTELTPHTVDELSVYINYVKSQELQLDQSEKEKETFKNTYFVKDVKDR
jgi:hypothetical protein